MSEIEQIRKNESYKPVDRLMTAGAFAIGILFVCLFYGKYPGISVPIFVAAFYALLLSYKNPAPAKEAGFGWFLSIPVMFISLTYFLFGNEILMVLNTLALPVLILLQTLLITGANSYKWHNPLIVVDLLFAVFIRCFIHTLKPFGIISSMIRKNSDTGGKKSVWYRVLTGLLISVPLVIILLSLLSSADMVFGSLVEKLPDLFGNIKLDEFIAKAIVALVIFVITFSYLWSVAHDEKPAGNVRDAADSKTPKPKRRLDQITVITITTAVDILYAVFVVIQFTYLFGGSGLPDGFTYAEYARSGFFELILVSLLNIGLLACTLTYTKKGTTATDITFRVLNTTMIGCTFIMLFSAHYRMSLYENAYGFTFLRIMTHAFMVFLLVLFIITLARVWMERMPLLKPYIAAAVVAFVVINYINADVMIAKNNIRRYYETNAIDMNYFRSLSNDAVGELIELAGDKNAEVAAAAGEILKSRKDRLDSKYYWQSFNLSDHRARKALEKGW